MAAVAHAVPHLRAGGARLVYRARGAAARTALKPKRHPLLPLLVRLRLPPEHVGMQAAERLERGHRRARRRGGVAQRRAAAEELLALEPVEV